MILASVIASICLCLIAHIARTKAGINVLHAERAAFIGVFVTLTIFVLSAVRFLKWLYLTTSNARFIHPDSALDSPREAVICWFVPIHGIVAPLILMKQLGVASEPESTRSDKRLSSLTWIWWFSWTSFACLLVVLAWISDRQNQRMLLQSPNLPWVDLAALYYSVCAAAELSYIVAALCLVSIMRKIAMHQDMSFAEQQAAPIVSSDQELDSSANTVAAIGAEKSGVDQLVAVDQSEEIISRIEEPKLQP